MIIVKHDLCLYVMWCDNIQMCFSNGFLDPNTIVAEFCGCVARIYNFFKAFS